MLGRDRKNFLGDIGGKGEWLVDENRLARTRGGNALELLEVNAPIQRGMKNRITGGDYFLNAVHDLDAELLAEILGVTRHTTDAGMQIRLTTRPSGNNLGALERVLGFRIIELVTENDDVGGIEADEAEF